MFAGICDTDGQIGWFWLLLGRVGRTRTYIYYIKYVPLVESGWSNCTKRLNTYMHARIISFNNVYFRPIYFFNYSLSCLRSENARLHCIWRARAAGRVVRRTNVLYAERRRGLSRLSHLLRLHHLTSLTLSQLDDGESLSDIAHLAVNERIYFVCQIITPAPSTYTTRKYARGAGE